MCRLRPAKLFAVGKPTVDHGCNMGIYAEFYRGSSDGALSHFLSSPLSKFRDWFHHNMLEFPDDFDSAELMRIDEIIAFGAQALCPKTSEEAVLIDRVTDRFYGDFCGVNRTFLTAAVATGLYSRHYENRLAIKQSFGDESLRLWEYLINGRPIGRAENSYKYSSCDGIFHVGFWTYEEVYVLRTAMKVGADDFSLFEGLQVNAMRTAFHALENVYADRLGMIIIIA